MNNLLYIDKRLEKKYFEGKGYGLKAKEEIEANTIIIKEKPSFCLESNEKIFSDIFQLLYKILNNDDIHLKCKFLKLLPQNLKNFPIDKNKIQLELNKLKKHNLAIFNYFQIFYSLDDIYLYCAKYMCNAFQFNDNPVILLNATLINHSCIPNVIFGNKEDIMYFKTIRKINF